jgi:hypothetical protein
MTCEDVRARLEKEFENWTEVETRVRELAASYEGATEETSAALTDEQLAELNSLRQAEQQAFGTWVRTLREYAAIRARHRT